MVISSMLAWLLANFLCGISRTDWITCASTATIWIAIAVAACYLPARRVARVQPMIALRWEQTYGSR